MINKSYANVINSQTTNIDKSLQKKCECENVSPRRRLSTRGRCGSAEALLPPRDASVEKRNFSVSAACSRRFSSLKLLKRTETLLEPDSILCWDGMLHYVTSGGCQVSRSLRIPRVFLNGRMAASQHGNQPLQRS